MQSRRHWNSTCHVHGLAGEGCHFCGTVSAGKVEGVSGDLGVLIGNKNRKICIYCNSCKI